MKTSNLLLIIALAFLLTGTVFLIVKVKQFIVIEPVEMSGKTIEKIQEIASFENLHVAGAVELTIIKSDTNKLVLEADTTILSRVVVNQEGNTLTIKLTSMWGKKVNVHGDLYITNLDLNNIDAGAGAIINSSDTIKSANLKVDISAGANVNLPVSCENLECASSAGADAFLSGQAKEFKSNASAGAHIKAGNLVAEDVWADASAGADILVNATKSLDVNCSAGGSVRYYGNPVLKNIDVNAGGSLSKAD